MTYQIRLSLGLAIVFAFYIASNLVTAALVPVIYEIQCSVAFLTTVCHFAPDTAEPMGSYAVLGSTVLIAMAALSLFWRDTVAYPFLILFGSLALSTMAFDLYAGNPVINGPKITNDTINILGSVIAASFILLLIILRHQQYSLVSLSFAAASSYAIKVISLTFFVAVREGVHGATELYLLYVVYAFGAFSLHLMTVCGFIARTASAKQETLV